MIELERDGVYMNLSDDNKNEIESISIENKKLNEYLSKLNNIEQKIRTGN